MKYRILITLSVMLLGLGTNGQQYFDSQIRKQLIRQQIQKNEWGYIATVNADTNIYKDKHDPSIYKSNQLYFSVDIAIVLGDTFFNPIYEVEINQDMYIQRAAPYILPYTWWSDWANDGQMKEWYSIYIYPANRELNGIHTDKEVHLSYFGLDKIFVTIDAGVCHLFKARNMQQLLLRVGDRFKADYGEVYYTILEITDDGRVRWDCKGRPYWMKIVNINNIQEWIADKRLTKVN